MDISADKYKSDVSRPGPFLTVLQTVRAVTRRLVGFFRLTEADLLKAGVYRHGEERGEEMMQ